MGTTDSTGGEWVSTLKTCANVWHCDQQGHMNTRHIEGLFDDATAYFFARRFGAQHLLAAAGIGWADRKHGFEFLHEILAGEAIDVATRVERVGTTSVTVAHRMTRAADGGVLAAAEIVTVCFDLTTRRSRPLPPMLEAAA
jgi:acyl-CoA thioester hydrolase